MPQDTAEPIKPLTWWEKTKAGMKGFISHAVGSIIPGALMTAAVFAASRGLGAVTGWDFMHIGTSSWAEIGKMGLTSLALGSVISGSIGAWKSVSDAVAERNGEIAAQAGGHQQSLARGQTLQSDMSGELPAPQADLPIGSPVAHRQPQRM